MIAMIIHSIRQPFNTAFNKLAMDLIIYTTAVSLTVIWPKQVCSIIVIIGINLYTFYLEG